MRALVGYSMVVGVAMTQSAAADIILLTTPQELIVGEPTVVTFSLLGRFGADFNVRSVAFDFAGSQRGRVATDARLAVEGFSWAAKLGDAGTRCASNLLPDPHTDCGRWVLRDNEPLQLATVTVTARDTGRLLLAPNVTVIEDGLREYFADTGDPVEMQAIVPEWATLWLMGLGVAALSPRRLRRA